MSNGPARIALALTSGETRNLERWVNTDSNLARGVTVELQRRNGPIVVVRAQSQELLVRAATMVRALAIGFNFDDSKSLLNPDNYLLDVPFKPDLPPRDRKKSGRVLVSRLDSFKIANLRVIENFTGVKCKFQNDRLWLLGPAESVQEGLREARQIIMGRTRGTVQQFHRGKHGAF